MSKKQQKTKTTFASAFKEAKGFGSLPEADKKKSKLERFRQVLKGK